MKSQWKRFIDVKMLFLIFIGNLCLLTVENPLGIPRGSPGDYQEIDGPVPEPYRTEVVPYRSRTVRDSHGIPRDPLQPPLPPSYIDFKK